MSKIETWSEKNFSLYLEFGGGIMAARKSGAVKEVKAVEAAKPTTGKRVKVFNVDTLRFVETFATMVKQGKSALEVGQALGLQGDSKRIAQYVNIKASQIRKKLEQSATNRAKLLGLNPEDTAKLVSETVGRLPRIRAQGRPAQVTNAILDVLNRLDN